MKKHQPTIRPGTRSTPEPFEILYPPTPDGHLSEEQKKWPVVTESKPRAPRPEPTPAEQTPQPVPPAE